MSTGNAPGTSRRELARPVKFEAFEFHPETLELRSAGAPVRMQELPARLLAALLRNPGELVTREQLQGELWPSNTFVQFDAGLNTAVNKLRLALRDSADRPKFIETVPRTGYRFIAPVERMELRAVPPPVLEGVAVLPVVPSEAETEEHPAAPTPAPQPNRRRWWLGIAVVLASCAALLLTLGPSSPARPLHFAVDLPPGQQFQFYSGRQIAISPDGNSIAWIAAANSVKQIYVRRLDATDVRPLTGSERADGLCFSPDGGWVAYVAGGGELRKASVDGRWNVKLLDLPGTWDASMVWAPDGWIYFSAGNFQPGQLTRKMFRVNAAGGKPEVVLPDPRPVGAEYPQQWLPRGLLFTIDYAPSDEAVDLWAPAERKRYELVRNAAGGRYLPTGHLVFSQSGNLMAVPFDLHRMEMRGKPAMVVPDIAPDRWAGVQIDVSETGTLIYFRGVNVHERQPVWVDLGGRESPANLPSGRYHLLDLSAAGRFLLTRYGTGDHFTSYSFQPDKSLWEEVLSGETPNTSGIWSPDGSSIAVGAALQGERMGTLYIKPLDTAAPPHPLLPSSYLGIFPQSWSRAANAIVYTEGYSENTKRDIRALSLAAGAKPDCIACGPANEVLPSFSPDGRWIAYTSDDSGRNEVYVQRYPRSAAPIRVSPEGGQNSLWAPSGKELYYRKGEDVWAIAFDSSTGKQGRAHRLFSGKYDIGGNWNRDWLISPSGTRFLMLKIQEDPPEYRRIQVIVNWFEELRKSVNGNS